jgi:hypothetical protein
MGGTLHEGPFDRSDTSNGQTSGNATKALIFNWLYGYKIFLAIGHGKGGAGVNTNRFCGGAEWDRPCTCGATNIGTQVATCFQNHTDIGGTPAMGHCGKIRGFKGFWSGHLS